MFAKAFFLLALIPSILAVDHAVTVGQGNALSFTPSSITAAVGDTVTFTVYGSTILSLLPSLIRSMVLVSLATVHSVTTTNFSGAVCPPPPGGVGPNGFDSGFLSDLDGSLPSFTYKVVDTAPHFGACMQAAGGHCRAGMTFAINPTTTQTYEQFLANARSS
ncbi:hypothetical protein R3P38DRAFT_3170453 [Favolaschia claudopus]|uniref:Uncharacterized protein n=1 Tax=Favolaschia claudopus TaxID=2862362 RepID=A0AAW0DSL5_9AGAR